MSDELRTISRERPRTVDLRRLRVMILYLLGDLLSAADFDLVVQLVNSSRMARLNKSHLQHEGSTDVITLDYSDGPAGPLVGEIFICVNEARAQARRFRTTWQAELARYVVHGTLHLRGYDDRKPVQQRRMKREEDRLVRELSRRFDLSKLKRGRKLAA